MEDFEKYIVGLGDRAEDVEPGEGHFARFEDRLSVRKVNKRRQLLRKSMRVAAVGVLLVMSSLYVYTRFDGPAVEVVVNPDFVEAQYYYKTQISDGLRSIEEMESVIPDDQREVLLEELSTADTLFLELQEAYEASPNDERVIKAMLKHYRVKAMVINNILNNLEKVNGNSNIKNDEQVEI